MDISQVGLPEILASELSIPYVKRHSLFSIHTREIKIASGTTAPPKSVTACRECPLRKCGAYLPNSSEEIDFIASLKMGERNLKAGDELIAEHSESADLYTLLSGLGFRFRTLGDGRRQILNFLMPGDLIGLQQKMDVEATHGVQMLTDSVACRFSRDSLWKIFSKHPSLGYDVTWLAAHEESMVDENLLSAGRRNAAERMGSFLIRFYRRAFPIYGRKGKGVPFPVNQQHISDALGLSLVHTNKTLRRLYRLGLFEIKDGWLRLLDVDALKKLGDLSTDMDMEMRRVI